MENIRELREQLVAAEQRIAKLASIKEVLLLENRTLRASGAGSNVVAIR